VLEDRPRACGGEVAGLAGGGMFIFTVVRH
jgi:hypothetical protein